MIAAVVVGYLLGSIPFAVFVARMRGIDPRRAGSGNPGATNVLRTAGAGAGVAVAVLDIAKGAASVLAAERFHGGETAAAAAGVAAVVGHVFPVWLQFRGGKGIATACGAFLVLAPLATVLAASVFFVVSWSTRYVSLGSILAAAALPSIAYVAHGSGTVLTAAFAIAALVLLRHKDNMARLLTGVEPRL
jgi:acyl phosphate:glycerol-3-phosphate acyltransferase